MKEYTNTMTDSHQPRLKKSLERSFDDLLKGLEDESLPDLDDLITDEIEDVSILTPTPSQRNDSVRIDKTFPGPILSLQDDIVDDEQNEMLDFNNHADVQHGDDSDTSDEEFDSENKFAENDIKIGFNEDLVETQFTTPRIKVDDVQTELRTDEVMDEDENNSAFDDNDGKDTEDLDFSVTEDTDQLNLDHSKHKKSLGRRGSLANRRKPTRSGRRSSMTDFQAVFQDSTDLLPSKNSQDDSSTSDEELPSQPAMTPLKAGFALPVLQPNLLSTKLKSTAHSVKDNKTEDSTPQQVNLKPVVKTIQNSEVKKQSESHTFEKPLLRNIDRNDSKLDSNKEHVFNKPALRNVDIKLDDKERDTSEMTVDRGQSSDAATSGFNRSSLRRREQDVQDKTIGGANSVGVFRKPELRKVEVSKTTNIHNADLHVETFEKPSLRNVGQVRTPNKMSDKSEIEKPDWLTNMRLKKVCNSSNDRTIESQDTEKPSWLQSATKKKTKLAEFMKTKENQSEDSETTDKNMSALTSESVFKTPRSLPLTENGENVRNIHIADSVEENNHLGYIKDTKNNYTPSWLKSKDNLKPQSVSKFPSASAHTEIPQWKLELANRNKMKKKEPQDNHIVTDKPEPDSNLPPWRRELSQRKKRPVVQQASVSTSSEPEWKKMADERRARLTRIGLPGQHTTK